MTSNTDTFSGEDLNFDDLQFEPLALDSGNDVTPSLPERDLSFFRHIPVTVTLEVASKEISLGELMKAGAGSVIELDKLNGEPLDVKVNGRLLGHAEVIVTNDKYGLRLIDVVDTAFDGMGQ